MRSPESLLGRKHLLFLRVVTLPLIYLQNALLVVLEPDGRRSAVDRVPQADNVQLILDLLV